MSSKSQTSKLVLGIFSFLIHILLNVLFYVIVIMLITKYSGVAYDFAYQVFGDAKPVLTDEEDVKSVTITIQRHESTMSVARKLELNRVIENKYSFYLRAKLYQENIKTGKYLVDTSMSYSEILGVITDYNNNLDKEKDAVENKKKETETKNTSESSTNSIEVKSNNP